MWQRIQTLYLAIACALTASLFFCNIANIVGADGIVEHIRYSEKLIYLVLTIVCMLTGVLSIFTWKLRLLQMRLAILTALLLLGIQGVIVSDWIANHDVMVFSVTAIFPIIASILCFMASRKIFQDEIMVRASSRLRDTRKR